MCTKDMENILLSQQAVELNKVDLVSPEKLEVLEVLADMEDQRPQCQLRCSTSTVPDHGIRNGL